MGRDRRPCELGHHGGHLKGVHEDLTPGSALSPALVSAWLETRSLRGLGNEDAISLRSTTFWYLEDYHLVILSTCEPPSWDAFAFPEACFISSMVRPYIAGTVTKLLITSGRSHSYDPLTVSYFEASPPFSCNGVCNTSQESAIVKVATVLGAIEAAYDDKIRSLVRRH